MTSRVELNVKTSGGCIVWRPIIEHCIEISILVSTTEKVKEKNDIWGVTGRPPPQRKSQCEKM